MDSDFSPANHAEPISATASSPTDTHVPSAGLTASTVALGQNDQPIAVVKVLSVRGVEYLMMTLALWVAAASLTGIVLSLINGNTSFNVLAFPISALVVAVVLFSLFFLRLKKAELQTPALRFDPSKRRLSQATQVVSYIVSFIALVGLVYTVVSKIGGNYKGTLWKTLLDFVVILLVAGGIWAYYWVDEHKVR